MSVPRVELRRITSHSIAAANDMEDQENKRAIFSWNRVFSCLILVPGGAKYKSDNSEALQSQL
ncbi:MAG: hypothetical protein A2283_07515 [Lentisphaerae bacterium RIFOXYA12_FULL_48_11]|nr:MAG: hypothetical protein A2283_07515 [Lentisphaerae bacterium RIFOXYA12_FULL_48_11]